MYSNLRLILLCLSLPFILLSCKSKELAPDPSTPQVYLMTFNVENLFDLKDDPEKKDETFLPLSRKASPSHKKKCKAVKQKHWRKQCLEWNWDAQALHTKMLRLSKAVRQANGGRGPDVLFLQEVENIEVLKEWNEKYLGDLNYTEVILIEGKDARGIDVAFLSRLPQTTLPQLHFVPYKGASERELADTRGLLEAHFRLPDGGELVAFNVHFPAPFHPAELRAQTFEALNEKVKQLPQEHFVVAAGDFNVTSEENKKLDVLSLKVKPSWIIAHQAYCHNCRGTTYYKPTQSWSFLDMILLSETFNQKENAWKIEGDSMAILNEAEGQKTKEGYPARFELPELTGVSDHWPLGLRIVKPQ